MDEHFNIYYSDQDANKVKVIEAASMLVSTIAGTGEGGNSGDNGAATSAELYDPFMVYGLSSQTVYFVDYRNHQIRHLSSTGPTYTPSYRPSAVPTVSRAPSTFSVDPSLVPTRVPTLAVSPTITVSRVNFTDEAEDEGEGETDSDTTVLVVGILVPVAIVALIAAGVWLLYYRRGYTAVKPVPAPAPPDAPIMYLDGPLPPVAQKQLVQKFEVPAVRFV